jgi:predicted site-specific integrase-resolvase
MRLTIIEAAEHFKVTRKTIDRWIKADRLELETLPSGRKLVIGVKENNG